MNSMKKITNMPMPSNINIWWNWGSILGLSLMNQIVTGMILSMNYSPNTSMAFQSIIHINNNTLMGWFTRNLHINGASLFFISMFIHLMRGIYFSSYKLKSTWTIGVVILISSMMTAFLGYILPWGQMSYWGATVITNLISAIPYIGETLVLWVWGGFSVNNATLNRFFSLHFIMPEIIALMVMIHIMSLHSTGSSNPMGTNSKMLMVPFNPYFIYKDYIGFIMMSTIMIILCTQMPLFLTDPDNFKMANPMDTPHHIKPEWYFLFAYSILRSVPNKLGGVVCLAMSISMFLVFTMIESPKMNSLQFYPPSILFWNFVTTTALLSWTGNKSIEYPFTVISPTLSIMYFSFFILLPLSTKYWEKNMQMLMA